MRALARLALVALLFVAGDAGASCCCCGGGFKSAGGVPPAQFATSCYSGTGTDDRIIPTGITADRAGFLRVCEKTVQAGNNNVCAWKIPEMAGDLSCAASNADFDTGGGFDNCGTNRIQDFGEGFFELGTASEVNASGRPYCYEQWALDSRYHGTFTYTGDGTGTRTVVTGLDVTPAVVFVGERNTASSNDNIPWIRMPGMPANTSYPSALFSTTGDTAHVRDPGAGTIVVGATWNANGATYSGAWWAEGALADAITYTGNGTSLATGTCGALADTQTVAFGCAPRDVWLTTSQSNSENAGTCVSLTRQDRCQRFRSIATSLNTIGPGALTGSDLYAYTAVQPNNSGPGLIGDLDLTTDITVTGGANFVASCNDNGRTYYGFASCGTAPTIGINNTDNWADANGVISTWEFEDESAGDAAINNRNVPIGDSGTVACPYPDCDLADNATVGRSTSIKVLGEQSAAFTAASSQFLSCALSGGSDPCDELNVGATDFAISGYVYPLTDADMTVITKGVAAGNVHYRITRNAANDNLTASVRTSAGGTVTVNGANNSFPAGRWSHFVMQFDDAGDTLGLYVNANAGGTSSMGGNDVDTGTGTIFNMGRNTNSSSVFMNGYLDDINVWPSTLSATARCRLCSCGATGQLCSCFASDPTVYVDTGYNGSLCGACTLPACNATAP